MTVKREAETVLEVGIAAALADGRRDERELARLREVARATGVDPSSVDAATAALHADLAARLPSEEARRAAYELAVAVCGADGTIDDAEERFLAGLRAMLGLTEEAVAGVHRDARAIAAASVPSPATTGASTGVAPRADDLDELILQQAKLTGALELLPQSLASMAIIPLQMRMVYRIGQAHGQALDAAQVQDLLGTMGIGMAAQVVDGVARKIVGGVFAGVLGSLLGGLAGGVAGAASGAVTSFATTYALGHAAKQYYAQGRALSADDLRALFARLKDEATNLYPQVRSQIESQASSLDLSQILKSIGRA
jgi:tellurite resistance protein/uncharacterized protein (DUF697 family)